jgi:AhpD family alkylhydroperoxidase
VAETQRRLNSEFFIMANTTVHIHSASHGPTADAHSDAERIDFTHIAPGALRAQLGLETYIRGCGLETSLIHIVNLRASMINGCAYCVDMHTKDARLAGETEQRLYAVSVWHEAPFFSARERAALAWTDALTDISRSGVPDDLFKDVRAQFSDKELVDLTMVVVAINGWNRLAVSLRAPVGGYVPGESGANSASSGDGRAASAA